MTSFLSRRNFIIAGSLSGLAAAGYTAKRGLRFPSLGFEPDAPLSSFAADGISISVTDMINTPRVSRESLNLRAYGPEPSLQIDATKTGSVVLSLGNLATDAELRISNNDGTPARQGAVQENAIALNRIIKIDLNRGESLILSWHLPSLQDYTFASIGDTGGDKELAWCIQRAYDLGARFLLHLGDFNYQSGDYDRAVDLFNNAPLPCYVTIGNHDFHDNGLVYPQFLQQIGPFSHAFTIGKTRFANIDTAASFLPYSSGQRGQLIKSLAADSNEYADTVAFTHKPLHDPAGDTDHDIGNIGERDWLIKSLHRVGAKCLLSGHIHIYNRDKFKGIDNIIVGQGLGHQDIMVNYDISKMAIGQVNQDGHVSYDVAKLAMPMEFHCHPRTDIVKESLIDGPNAELVKRIDAACDADL